MVLVTVFFRPQGAIKRLNIHMTSTLCVQKTFQSNTGKGRAWLRSDEFLSTGPQGLVVEVRYSHSWYHLCRVMHEHWHRWDRGKGGLGANRIRRCPGKGAETRAGGA